MSMRVLHVVDSLEYGGLERVVTDLAIAQRSLGHELTVFSLQDTTGLVGELRAAGIEVVIGHKRGGFDLRLLGLLRRTLRERRIDVVHSHNFVPNYHAAAAMLGLLWRRPLLVSTTHDMGTRLSNARLRRFYRWSLGATQGVAMVGRQVHDHFVSTGLVRASKAVTVLNAIPVERFDWTPERRKSARQAMGLAADELVIGAVGRLVELKNHRLLIDLMPELLRREPRARLVVIGSGPLQESLQARIDELGLHERVQLLGQRRDVADLTVGFDVFALPSTTEGLSIALLEGAANRLAIVASEVGGNPEIVRHGDTGLLVPVGDGDALLDALLHLLGDPDLRVRLASAAQAWVREHASVTMLARSYDAFYARCGLTA